MAEGCPLDYPSMGQAGCPAGGFLAPSESCNLLCGLDGMNGPPSYPPNGYYYCNGITRQTEDAQGNPVSGTTCDAQPGCTFTLPTGADFGDCPAEGALPFSGSCTWLVSIGHWSGARDMTRIGLLYRCITPCFVVSQEMSGSGIQTSHRTCRRIHEVR